MDASAAVAHSSAPLEVRRERRIPWVTIALTIVAIAAIAFGLFSCAAILSSGAPLLSISGFNLLEKSFSVALTSEGGKFLLGLGATFIGLLLSSFSFGRLTTLENL